MNWNEGTAHILTINGGSSSIKFALYQNGKPLERILSGTIDRIGLSGTNLSFNEPAKNRQDRRGIVAADHKSAASFLMDWLAGQRSFESVGAVGHRIVHGMQRRKRSRCFVTRSKNGSAPSRRPSVDWTRLSSQVVLERTHRKSAAGFARSWGFLESTSKKSETQRMTP